MNKPDVKLLLEENLALDGRSIEDLIRQESNNFRTMCDIVQGIFTCIDGPNTDTSSSMDMNRINPVSRVRYMLDLHIVKDAEISLDYLISCNKDQVQDYAHELTLWLQERLQIGKFHPNCSGDNKAIWCDGKEVEYESLDKIDWGVASENDPYDEIERRASNFDFINEALMFASGIDDSTEVPLSDELVKKAVAYNHCYILSIIFMSDVLSENVEVNVTAYKNCDMHSRLIFVQKIIMRLVSAKKLEVAYEGLKRKYPNAYTKQT